MHIDNILVINTVIKKKKKTKRIVALGVPLNESLVKVLLAHY